MEHIYRVIAFCFLYSIFGASLAGAGGFMDKFEQMLDRVTDKISEKTEERLNITTDKALTGAFDNTDKMVDCALTDKECVEEKTQNLLDTPPQHTSSMECVATDTACLKEAQANGKQVILVEPTVIHTGATTNTMKCLVTDVLCLKEAQSLGKQVQIVDESQIDKFRCQITDVECLQKAKTYGKQVEIVD